MNKHSAELRRRGGSTGPTGDGQEFIYIVDMCRATLDANTFREIVGGSLVVDVTFVAKHDGKDDSLDRANAWFYPKGCDDFFGVLYENAREEVLASVKTFGEHGVPSGVWFTATLNNKRVSVMFATIKTIQRKQSYVVNIKLVDGA